MQNRERWVPEEHAWSGVTHHTAHPFAHLRFVAVDGTICAGRFARAIGALLDPLQCVGFKLRAFSAQPALRLVMCSAIHKDHNGNGFAFAS